MWLMTIAQALIYASNQLETTSTSALLDADVLLSFILNQSKEYLAANPTIALTTEEEEKYLAVIAQRQTGQPVAYLTGTKEFFGHDFFVSPRVLIPRPDTELLVETALALAEPGDTIADIGTGSGCIACSLALAKTDLHIIATDISADALAVAQKNAEQLKANIQFLQGDLLAPLHDQKLDILVANLPYLSQDQLTTQSPATSSLQFEPSLALAGGSFGLELYTKFFEQLLVLRHRPRLVAIEIDPGQTNGTTALINQLLPTATMQIKKDLAGLNRILIIFLKQQA